jgi:hypothetical protein
MPLINHMKFGFSEPAPDPDPCISAVKDLRRMS